MTPSRSAHGQISSSVEVEDVHARLGDERARHDLVGPRLARRPGSTASSSPVIATSLGIHSPGPSAAACAGPGRRRPTGAAPQIRASERNVLDVAAARSGAPARSSWPASRAISARILRRSCLQVVLVGTARREVLPRQPGRAQRQRPGDVGRLVGAAGDLERAAADVEDRQPAGRPAEPAAYGEERQPRLVLTGRARRCATPVRSWTWSSTSSAVAGVAHRRGREAERSPRSPCPRRRRTRRGDEVGERVDARSRRRRPPRRGARPAGAAPCRSTPAAVRRRRGRRPRAGARCWSRCRGRPGAWANGTSPSRHPRTLAACPEVDLVFPRAFVEFVDPGRRRPRCCAAT